MFAKQFVNFVRESHLPERIGLSIESALNAVRNPTNGIHISQLGELTGRVAAQRMIDQMMKFEDGRRVLRDKPLIAEPAVMLSELRTLPDGTLGREYVRFMDTYQFHPHEREPVRHLLHPDHAYAVTRYRQVHDFQHTLWGLSISVESELALKVIELSQTGLPMTAMATMFGPLAAPTARLVEREDGKFDTVDSAKLMKEEVYPWASRAALKVKRPLHTIYIEEWFDKPVEDLRKMCGIEPVPARLQHLLKD